MRLLFDARVLTHKNYTGVENYAKNISKQIAKSCSLVAPASPNRYLAHLWTHLILPFKDGDTLFCPANIAPIFVPKSKKLVLTIHDVAFLTYPKSFSRLFRLYYQWLIPINIKRADKIITVSHSSKREILKHYRLAEGKIEAICLGVDKKYRVLDDVVKKKKILYVGSLNERKNFCSIIKAFERLDMDDYKLVIVGNFSSNFAINDKTYEVLQKAKKSQKIEFKLNVSDSDLVKLYNEASLFVFPSFYEGFGLSVLEAMACATPVVCSSTSSLPEVGGDAVVYCDPHSVEDIKQKIELVLSDESLQKKMIEKGLERVKEFSWEKSALEHMRVFEDTQSIPIK